MTNHLWQSTLVAVAAGLLTLTLRRNSARVRYWVWLAASIKFLIPFSALIALGSGVEWRPAETPPAITVMFERAGKVLAPASTAPSFPRREPDTSKTLAALWACGSVVIAVRWIVRWRRASRANKVLEPGVFGLFRPVVRMPDGIRNQLTESQMDAILAHELCHARYRDNLTAAIHMSVETLFWFHPLVWWIGARLLDERERACDEEVLRQGHNPDTYAEGILRVCRFYIEQPIAFIPGVTGSNLKLRIESILENRMTTRLTRIRRLQLCGIATAAIVGPVAIGLWNAPPARAQAAGNRTFSVAAIKPSGPNYGNGMGRSPSGDFTAVSQTLQNLVSFAYLGEIVDLGRVSGGPSWVRSARFDIQAKADEAVPASALGGMLQALLAERFKLKVHEEIRQLPVNALVLADRSGKLGPNIRPVSREEAAYCDSLETHSDEAPERGKDGFNRCSTSGRGGIRLRGSPLSALGLFLGELLGRPMIDRTGLQGRYDADLLVELNWDHLVEGGPADDIDNGAVFEALKDQLGLKVESTRGPVRTIVIDSAEQPGEN